MTMNAPARQKGAVLFIALIMLLLLTLLATSSMRNVTLETRITANRAQTNQEINIADAGLREAEFRFYGPGNIAAKLTPNADNCSANNTLKSNGVNSPCLLDIKDENLMGFVEKPWEVTTEFLEDDSATGLIWMAYSGTDASNTTVASDTKEVKWNSMLIGLEGVNAEYGMYQEAKGTYYYLNNARAGEELYLQSTHANIYLGLNN
jgi:type IV pilus assembly protein PilX